MLGGGGGRICICWPIKPWGGGGGGLPIWVPGVKFAIVPLPPGGGGGAGGAPPGGMGLGPFTIGGGGGGNDPVIGGGGALGGFPVGTPGGAPCGGGGGGGGAAVPLGAPGAGAVWGLFASCGLLLKYSCNCTSQ